MAEQRIRRGPPPPPPPPPPPSDPYSGPNYEGFVFTLLSGSGKATHFLTIAKQYNEQLTNTAYITGTWQGDGDPKAMTGAIIENGGGINCGWYNLPTDPTVHNILIGTLSYSAGKFGQVRPSGYLEGDVTSYDANTNTVRPGGPGHVYGDGGPPAVLLEA
jgi:hypothetical protein